jgi:hypothetical protein
MSGATMIELALGIPVIAMIAMIALARLERSLDQAVAEPEPVRTVRRPRAAGTIRVRRSGQPWALSTRGSATDVSGVRNGGGIRAASGVGAASEVRAASGVGAVGGVGAPPGGRQAGLLGR